MKKRGRPRKELASLDAAADGFGREGQIYRFVLSRIEIHTRAGKNPRAAKAAASADAARTFLRSRRTIERAFAAVAAASEQSTKALNEAGQIAKTAMSEVTSAKSLFTADELMQLKDWSLPQFRVLVHERILRKAAVARVAELEAENRRLNVRLATVEIDGGAYAGRSLTGKPSTTRK